MALAVVAAVAPTCAEAQEWQDRLQQIEQGARPAWFDWDDAEVQLAQAAQTPRQFDIPPQSLTDALALFGRQSGMQVSVDARLIQGIPSPGVTGSMLPEHALAQLLANTGITYRLTGDNTAMLQRATDSGVIQLDPLQVEGRLSAENARGPVEGYVAERSATGTKSDDPILEVPQTINVVTADQIGTQGAQSIGQALRYTPGVRAEGYGASSPFDIYTQVRGFRSDLYLNGLRLPTGSADGLSSSVVEPWGLERVEVLKGPASGLYGQSGPGGLINMVSKRPTAAPLHEVQLQAGSFDRFQGAFDFGGPIDEEGEFLYRLTGLARDSDTQIDYVEDNRVFVAPSLTWQPEEDTSLTLLASYQRDHGVWSFFNYLPAEGSLDSFDGERIPTDRFLGEPDFNTMTIEQMSIGYEFEHRFNDTVAVRQNLRFGHSDFFTKGAVTGRSYLNPDGTIDRLAIAIDTDDATLALDNNVLLDFVAGPLAHDVVAGVDYRWSEIDYAFDFGLAPPLDVFDPDYGSDVADPDLSLENYDSTQTQVGVYLQDQVRLDRWLVTLGGRYDWADSDTRSDETDFAAAFRTKQHDEAFTGRVGLTYLFDSGIAPYASYATSFQPEAGLDSVTGQPFKPSTGQQYEVGIKYQPPQTRMLLTLAAFDLTQQNRITQDGFLQRQIGEVDVRGIELEGKAEVLDNLNVIASYAYLDHEITESADPAEVGLELFSTPNHQASLWADYTLEGGLLDGLLIGAGVRYVGSTLDSTNTVKVPGVTLVDAALQYDLGSLSPVLEGGRIALNVTNLFDEEYVSQCDGDTMCTYGSRRTILGTVSYRW